MSTLFISHSSKDNAAAEELRRRLEIDARHSCVFLDFDPSQGIQAGDSWERTLYRKLRASRVLIAICTDAYLDSPWCFAEVALARMEGKTIITLLTDGLTRGLEHIPSIMLDAQMIDLRTEPAKGYQRLWNKLDSLEVLGLRSNWDENKSPYLGLDPYTEDDAPVYFGREPEIRTGEALLKRGAAGLVMVLGASGSGKSSFVRAGVIPRLRPHANHWIVVNPFRPGRDPFANLAAALAQTLGAASREAQDHAHIKRLLETGPLHSASAQPSGPATAGADGEVAAVAQAALADTFDFTEEITADRSDTSLDDAPPDQEAREAGDGRLRRLMAEIESLKRNPPEDADETLRSFLRWSLDDLRRITGDTNTPGGPAPATPLIDMAEQLQRAMGAPDARVLIVIDQFEELLGKDRDSVARARFLDLLKQSLDAKDTPLMVFATMRSDFLDAFQQLNAGHQIDFETMTLGPLGPDALFRVIEEPARLAATGFEPGLTQKILEDARSPDGLPLLSYTLWKLWNACRESGEMTIAAYDRLGGVVGALAQEAEATLEAARAEGREGDLRRAFLQMVRLTADGQYARQSVLWDSPELRPVHDILTHLKSDRSRLLVPRMEDGVETVEVAHEALFRNWEAIRNWIDEARARLLFRQQLEQASQAWVGSGRQKDFLWHGTRLAQAVEFDARNAQGGQDHVSDDMRAFVRAGEAVRKRRVFRRRALTASVGSALSVLAGVALWAEHMGKAEQRISWARQQALLATSTLASDARTSITEARKAVCVTQSYDGVVLPEAQRALNRAVNAMQQRSYLRDHASPVSTVAFLPGTAGASEPVASGAPATRLGQRLLSLAADRRAMLWDVPGPDAPACAGPGGPTAFATASSVMATDATGETLAFGGTTGGISIFTLQDGAARPVPVAAISRPEAVDVLALSPDGRFLADALQDGRVVLTTMPASAPGRVLTGTFDGGVSALAFGPQNAQVAAAGARGTIRLWQTGTGAPLGTHQAHDAAITALVMQQDRIVSGDWDGVITLWRPQADTALTLLDHDAAISALAFLPGREMLVSASWDGTVKLWDLDRATVLRTLDLGSPVTAVDLIPRHGARPATEPDPVSFLLATATWDGDVAVHPLDGDPFDIGPSIAAIKHAAPVNALDFDATGRHLASASDDRAVGLTTLPRPDESYTWRSGLDVLTNDAGDSLIAIMQSQEVTVLDTLSGAELARFSGFAGTADAIAFSPEPPNRIAVRADRVFEYFLDPAALMSCAQNLVAPVPVAPSAPSASSASSAPEGLDAQCAAVPLPQDFRSLFARATGWTERFR